MRSMQKYVLDEVERKIGTHDLEAVQQQSFENVGAIYAMHDTDVVFVLYYSFQSDYAQFTWDRTKSYWEAPDDKRASVRFSDKGALTNFFERLDDALTQAVAP